MTGTKKVNAKTLKEMVDSEEDDESDIDDSVTVIPATQEEDTASNVELEDKKQDRFVCLFVLVDGKVKQIDYAATPYRVGIP